MSKFTSKLAVAGTIGLLTVGSVIGAPVAAMAETPHSTVAVQATATAAAPVVARVDTGIPTVKPLLKQAPGGACGPCDVAQMLSFWFLCVPVMYACGDF